MAQDPGKEIETAEASEGSSAAGPLAAKTGGMVGWLLGVAGAVAGAVVGHFLFLWIAQYGLYAIVLPGALAGAGCGALSGRRSMGLGAVCGVVGLAAGIYSEWRFAPFAMDDSLRFFLGHLHKLSPVTQGMILIGAGFGYWSGMGRERRANEAA